MTAPIHLRHRFRRPSPLLPPEPDGTPHVGLHPYGFVTGPTRGTPAARLVFRIEDTDAARDSEESYEQILDALRWLPARTGTRGVDVGGPHGPYRQSRALRRLRGRHREAQGLRARVRVVRHARGDGSGATTMRPAATRSRGTTTTMRDLTDRGAYRRSVTRGRAPALRLRVPEPSDLSFVDLVRGEITFKQGTFPDFVVVRPNGKPLYTFTNPVDDAALMGITHVLRGEDLLSSTPRQIALYERCTRSGSPGSSRSSDICRTSRRGQQEALERATPSSNLFHHRAAGMIPEGLVNYSRCSAGRSAPTRDVFSIDEMVAAVRGHRREPEPRPCSTTRRPRRSTATTSGSQRRRIFPRLDSCRTVRGCE